MVRPLSLFNNSLRASSQQCELRVSKVALEIPVKRHEAHPESLGRGGNPYIGDSVAAGGVLVHEASQGGPLPPEFAVLDTWGGHQLLEELKHEFWRGRGAEDFWMSGDPQHTCGHHGRDDQAFAGGCGGEVIDKPGARRAVMVPSPAESPPQR